MSTATVGVPSWSLQPLPAWAGRGARIAWRWRHRRFHARAYHWPIPAVFNEAGCWGWKTCPLCGEAVHTSTRITPECRGALGPG